MLGATRRFPGLRVAAAQHHCPEVARCVQVFATTIAGLLLLHSLILRADSGRRPVVLAVLLLLAEFFLRSEAAPNPFLIHLEIDGSASVDRLAGQGFAAAAQRGGASREGVRRGCSHVAQSLELGGGQHASASEGDCRGGR